MDITITVVLAVTVFLWKKVFGRSTPKKYLTNFRINFKKIILISIWISSGTIGIAHGAEKIQLIISSDPQYPWSEDHKMSDKDKEIISQALIKSQYKSMTKLNDRKENNLSVSGVIVNGDLTAFGHGNQLKEYKSLLDKNLNIPYYLGLGNHDYANNVDECANNGCAANMVNYVWDHIQKIDGVKYDFAETRSSLNGSLAYSFNIEKVHIVQLHNYPTYEKYWTRLQNARRVKYEIRSSMSWLENDLIDARNRGDVIILNMHDFGGEFKDATEELKRLINSYGVTAVFSGHSHSSIGYIEKIGKASHFRSGASTYQNYLLVKFDLTTNQLIVKKVENDLYGNYEIDSNVCKGCTVSLIAGKPSTPIPLIYSTLITINNLGLFEASFYVEYESPNGQKVTDYFGVGGAVSGVTPFYKQTFMVPARAKNIIVNARQRTGDASQPMREIFTERYNNPENLCFEVYDPKHQPEWKKVPISSCK